MKTKYSHLSSIATRILPLLALSLCFVTEASWASYTSVNGVSARGDSMQAFTAVADDPSAIFYNPAGLTQVPGTQIDATAVYVAPKQTFTSSLNNNNTETQSTRPGLGSTLFASRQMTQRVFVGVGMYAPFARTTDYDVNAATLGMTNSATLIRYDLVPTVAYAVSPNLSLGAGLVTSYIYTRSNILGLNEKATGAGFSGQLGALLKFRHGVKAGLTFRGPESASLHGDGSVTGISDTFDTTMRFPATLSAGLAWQVNPAWLLSVAYDEEFWSFVQQVQRSYGNPVLNAIGTNTLDGKNVGIPRAGVMYTYENNEFRVGYSYVPAAIPTDWIIPAKPDYDVNALAAGYSRYFRNLRLDAGLEYDIAASRTGTNTYFPGEYKAHALNFMLGLGYRFGQPIQS